MINVPNLKDNLFLINNKLNNNIQNSNILPTWYVQIIAI